MRHCLLLIGFFLSLLVPAFGQQDSLQLLLNGVIEQRDTYGEKKEQFLFNLKKNLRDDMPIQQRMEFNSILSKEYEKFILDSAVYYMRQNLYLVDKKDKKRYLDTRLSLIPLYSKIGMYVEALELMKSIDRREVDREVLPKYYEAFSEYFGHYAQSNNQVEYYDQKRIYRDSLLLSLPHDSRQYQLYDAEKDLYQHRRKDAEPKLLQLFAGMKDDEPHYAWVAYMLGTLYERKEEIALQKRYYTLSAIADIKNATKDNASLQSLGKTYYQLGNIDMAYKLTKLAIEDVVFCNVRFRTIEVSEFNTIINASYLEKEQKRKEEFELYSILITILSGILIITTLCIYLQVKKLSTIKKELYEANARFKKLNDDLQQANQKSQEVNCRLSEANQVKEEYIAQFFDMCSSYINLLDNYRKTLNKKAANKQMEDLFQLLRSTRIIEQERENLYRNFDNIFLNLFPSFIEDFNSLLIEEERIVLKPGELMNTELRIFALIRLGITDGVKIASFLQYSSSTIYNYRTKARNKAAVPREVFEEKLMEIGIAGSKIS